MLLQIGKKNRGRNAVLLAYTALGIITVVEMVFLILLLPPIVLPYLLQPKIIRIRYTIVVASCFLCQLLVIVGIEISIRARRSGEVLFRGEGAGGGNSGSENGAPTRAVEGLRGRGTRGGDEYRMRDQGHASSKGHDFPTRKSSPSQARDKLPLYQYSPLCESEIRLLEIEPNADDAARIEIQMVHMSLHTANISGYVALSYTWGTEEATHAITLAGKAFNVRPNLANILMKVRRLGCKLIWVGIHAFVRDRKMADTAQRLTLFALIRMMSRNAVRKCLVCQISTPARNRFS